MIISKSLTVSPELMKAPLFLALCEGLRWWLCFDGPQTALCRGSGGRVRVADVRRIAYQYNFSRLLSQDDQSVQKIAEKVNEFAERPWVTMDSRAEDIEKAVIELMESGATNRRLVSGMTKLTWFIAPKHWTPFDRLAAEAAHAKEIDALARMRSFYRRLEAARFLETSRAIQAHLNTGGLGEMGGERVLDKLLMMKARGPSADNLKTLATGFAQCLPPTLETAVIRTGENIVGDPTCHLALNDGAAA